MPTEVRSAGVWLYVSWMALIACLIPFEARAGLPWASIGPGGGEVVSLAIDPTNPRTLYAGTFEGGVFKSVDGGARWNAVNAGLTSEDPENPFDDDVQSLAIDPTAPQILYAGTFGGLFKSTNGGVGWSAINNGLPIGYVGSLAIDPANPQTLYAGTFGNGLFKSTNGGANWSAVNDGLSNGWVWSLAIDPANPQTLYAGTFGAGVIKSTNGGAAWSAVNNGMVPGDVRSLAIDPATPQTLYAGIYGGAFSGGVFKSTNGGASWNAVNVGLTDTDVLSLVIDPAAPQTLYAGISPTTRFGIRSGGGVFKSTDGGAAWSAVRTGLADPDVWSLAIDPANPQTLYAGTRGGGVFKSNDGGVGWSAVNTGLTNLDVFGLAIDAADPQTLYDVDGEVTYEECDRLPIQDILGLTSITFWERTSAAPVATTFAKGSSALTSRLTTLGPGGNDLVGVPSGEFYDVFYSDWNGIPAPNGDFVTIEAVWNRGAPSGGGLNISRVDFVGTGLFADSVASFVVLGNNALPNLVGNAVDGDDLTTATTMGNTIGIGQA